MESEDRTLRNQDRSNFEDGPPEYETSFEQTARPHFRWAPPPFVGTLLKAIGAPLNRAYIRTTTRIPLARFNGVDVKDLDRRMAKINWNKDYYSPDAISKGQKKARNERDIMRVNRIFRDLKKLSDSGDSRAEELRWKLQHRHWTRTKMQPQRANTMGEVRPFAEATPNFAKGAQTPPATQEKRHVQQVSHVSKEDLRQRRERISRKEISRTNSTSSRQRSKTRGVTM
jgi:hypothetical protein